eukprot:scaffold18251_cov65-Cyclotella_meneghiniana.AAC.5
MSESHLMDSLGKFIRTCVIRTTGSIWSANEGPSLRACLSTDSSRFFRNTGWKEVYFQTLAEKQRGTKT